MKDPGRKVSRFRSNLISAYTSGLTAQALPILAAPALTRIYGPTELGIGGLFLALATIAGALIGFRLDWAVSSTPGVNRAKAVFCLGIAYATGMALFLFALILIGYLNSWQMLETGYLEKYVLLVPVAGFCLAINALISALLIREARVRAVSRGRLIQTSVNTGLAVGLGALNGTATSLVLANLFGVAASAAFVWKQFEKRSIRFLAKSSQIRVRAIWATDGSSILMSGMSGVVNTFALFLPYLAVAGIYTSVELGWYSLMQRTVVPLVGVLGVAVTQSFWGEATIQLRRNPESLSLIFGRTIKGLMAFSLVVLAVGLLAPFIFPFVFGSSEWKGAGVLLAIYTPALIAQLVTSPMSPLLTMLGGARWILVWDMLRAIMIAVVFAVAYVKKAEIEYAVAGLSLGMSLAYVCLFAKLKFSLSKYVETHLKTRNDAI